MNKYFHRGSNFNKSVLSATIVLSLAFSMLFSACGQSVGGSAASSGQAAVSSGGGLAGKWLISALKSGDVETKYEDLARSGMATGIYLELDADGKGKLSMMGNDTEITCKDGKVSAYGQDLYKYEITGGDTMKFDMMGSVYTFVKEGSAAAANLPDVGSIEANNSSSTDTKTYSKKPNRHLMSTEKEYKVDGGVLYYEKDSDGIAISYGNVYADELKIPEEIDGKPVYAIRRLHGNIKNLYLPKTIKRIYASFGDFEGCEKFVIGNDSNDCALEFFSQGGCQYGHFVKDKLKEVIFPASMKENDKIKMTLNVMGGAFNLEKAENIPPIWEEGAQSLLKAEKMLSDPKKYIQTPSSKVKKLTDEVIAGAKDDREKVFLISQWICDNVSYDSVGYINYQAQRQAKYYGSDNKSDNNNKMTKWLEPDDVIDHKVTVCEGYARLTKAMCNAAGIPAVYVFGIIPPKKDLLEYHAWNMVYIDGAWQHIDNTASDKDYNASVSVDDKGELFAVETNEGGVSITYEMYQSNKELQKDYSWEDIQAINKANEDKYSFKNAHDYFCLPALAMGANHIAWEVDDVKIN